MNYTLIRWFPISEYSAGAIPSNYYGVIYTVPGEINQRVCFLHTSEMTDDLARQAIEQSILAKVAAAV